MKSKKGFDLPPPPAFKKETLLVLNIVGSRLNIDIDAEFDNKNPKFIWVALFLGIGVLSLFTLLFSQPASQPVYYENYEKYGNENLIGLTGMATGDTPPPGLPTQDIPSPEGDIGMPDEDVGLPGTGDDITLPGEEGSQTQTGAPGSTGTASGRPAGTRSTSGGTSGVYSGRGRDWIPQESPPGSWPPVKESETEAETGTSTAKQPADDEPEEEAAAVTEMPQQTADEAAQKGKSTQEKSNLLVIIGVAVFGIIAVGGGIGVYLYLKKMAEKEILKMIDYIKKYRAAGYDTTAIKKQLLNYFPEKDVEKAYQRLQQSMGIKTKAPAYGAQTNYNKPFRR